MATRTNVIECPHCGHEIRNFQDYVDPVDEDASFDMDCENETCGKPFHVAMCTTITFKTTRISKF